MYRIILMGTADVCGVVLAGGRSRRMGRNKALLEIEGLLMIERQLSLLRSRFAEVLISANDVAEYSFLKVPVVPDAFPGQGPLAGLHATFRYSKRDLILLLACDLPKITATLLDCLVAESGGHDAVVPRTPDLRLHPLCAVYRRSCLPIVERNLMRDDNSFKSLLEDPALKIRWLQPGRDSYQDDDLANLNSPEDLTRYGSV